MRNISYLMLISCLSAACTSELKTGTNSRENSHVRALESEPLNHAVPAKDGVVKKKGAESDVVSPVLTASSNGKITVSTLPTDTVLSELNGCGCGFYADKDRSDTIVGWLEQESPKAVMKINGGLEKLALIDEQNERAAGVKGRPESGDRTRFNLSNAKYEAVIECQVAETCWGKEGCEYIDYKCSMTTVSAEGSLTIPVVGTCGC